MPLLPNHLLKFLDREPETKFKSELLDLLNNRIKALCFEECERDRIVCTLTPMCSRRFLLKLRINDVYDTDMFPKNRVILRERKTGKENIITITNGSRELLVQYHFDSYFLH